MKTEGVKEGRKKRRGGRGEGGGGEEGEGQNKRWDREEKDRR